jgi:protein phosphatase 2C-like protein
MNANIRQVWGVSVRGTAHAYRGLPNQDAFLIRKTQNGVTAVVADGLGSKPYADVGAQQACRAAVRAIKTFENRSDIAFSDLLMLIQSYWISALTAYPASKCSATCLFLYVTDTDITAARLGDGMICLLGKNAADSVVLTDEKEDSFANATDCLTSEHILSKWEIKKYERSLFTSAVICTDGIASDLQDGAHRDFVRELTIQSVQKSVYKNRSDAKKWLTAWPVTGSGDDKTLIFMEL